MDWSWLRFEHFILVLIIIGLVCESRSIQRKIETSNILTKTDLDSLEQRLKEEIENVDKKLEPTCFYLVRSDGSVHHEPSGDERDTYLIAMLRSIKKDTTLIRIGLENLTDESDQ